MGERERERERKEKKKRRGKIEFLTVGIPRVTSFHLEIREMRSVARSVRARARARGHHRREKGSLEYADTN